MPVAPSMASRRMSACPAWRETSYSTWTSSRRNVVLAAQARAEVLRLDPGAVLDQAQQARAGGRARQPQVTLRQPLGLPDQPLAGSPEVAGQDVLLVHAPSMANAADIYDGPMSAPEHPDLGAVLAPLGASLPELAEATCAQIYAELDSYASISHEALTAAVRRNLDTAMDALRSGTVPHPAQLDGAAQTARERFEAGVPVEEIVRGFRISIALIHERFVDLAVTLGLPAEATVGGVRLMWGVADAFTTRIITEYHALEVDAALRDVHRRAATVPRAWTGALAPDTSRCRRAGARSRRRPPPRRSRPGVSAR